MHDRFNIASIQILGLILTVRFYSEPGFGPRRLGKGRYAFDITWISFLWEWYGT